MEQTKRLRENTDKQEDSRSDIKKGVAFSQVPHSLKKKDQNKAHNYRESNFLDPWVTC